jgi:hypothetical protein
MGNQRRENQRFMIDEFIDFAGLKPAVQNKHQAELKGMDYPDILKGTFDVRQFPVEFIETSRIIGPVIKEPVFSSDFDISQPCL